MPKKETRAQMLARIRDKIVAAEREYEKRVAELFPIDDGASYTHGDHEVPVTIVGHSFNRVRVHSLRSGREYWIYAYRLC